jgi:hypothetical protein
VATNEFGNALFRPVPPGVYTLTEIETGAVSEPFDVNQDLQFISVVNYVGAPVTPTATPTTAPSKPTKTPASGGEKPPPHPGGGEKATHPPVVGSGKTPAATHPPVVGSGKTPAATHPSRVMATVAAVSVGTTHTPVAAGTTPTTVTSLPSTGEGTVDAAPLGEAALVLLVAALLVVCGVITARRRVG